MSHSTGETGQGDAGRLEGAEHCIGCGQRPEELQPIEAVASLRSVQRRSTTLARRGQPDTVHPAGRPAPLASAVADAATRIPAALDSADRRLRHLFAEPQPLAVVQATPAAPGDPVTASLAAVPAVAERLVRTIAGATTEDWYHRRPGRDLSAAEITWLALHEATHYLEDVELALSQTSAAPDHPQTSTNSLPADGRIVAMNQFSPNRGSHPSYRWQRERSGAPQFRGDDAS